MCTTLCLVLKSSFVLSELLTETSNSELLVSLFHPSPSIPLPTLPGYSTEITPSCLVTVPPAIMQHAPKATNVLTHLHDVPSELQDTVRQALLDITYIDNGGVGADSLELHSELQDKIGKILKKGDIHIKAWESYCEVGCSKYLGRTWNRKDDRYLLKFRMNRHQKIHRIPSGEDKGSEFLLNKSLPITKKNVLSVACQFYDSNSLATPLMVTIRIFFSEVCRDRGAACRHTYQLTGLTDSDLQ